VLSYYDLQADRVLATAERSRKMNIATDSRDIHWVSLKRSFLSRKILQYINSCKERIMDFHPPVLYSWVDISPRLTSTSEKNIVLLSTKTSNQNSMPQCKTLLADLTSGLRDSHNS
jgi:hypothetical protein